MDDRFYMKEAINEAKLAKLEDEVPIGCVIERGGKIIGRGHNYTFKGKSALKHAEIIAIDKATKVVGDFRLSDCTMYVTMEPCSMCAGAIINSRIKRLVIALADVKRGACGSNTNITGDRTQLHYLDAEFGLMKDESHKLLKDFFENLRKRKKPN
ncbi:nucleoside deaminase [Anaerococcus sp. AGMB00486]|uniref:tRNA-specific adenosine deaminase n=2 Tax=Anaerococcus TaxID=165779 RepID=A0ABX2N9I7_9FIRM|nr:MULTISPECIES: nucleoside deaminase [Anaerococcus]MDY3006142.1 nucleoside deaminase [Anaerococcus porci]MSS78492.1 nucleoside deaminase [Anaerococcus porci]NVF11348.1 nucleoside deaminase [Anaerococcus faecalis]